MNATLVRVEKGSNPIMVVEFDDGIHPKISETFFLGAQTDESLRTQIENRRQFWENSYAFADTIDVDFLSNTVTTNPITPTPVTISDPVETAKADFRAIYSKRSRVNLGINLGFISLSDLSALDKDLQTKWATLVSLIGLDAAIDQI